MIVITPETEKFKSIFLAGTIDNGDSIDWQKKLIEKFKDSDIKIYNPRREHWDKKASKEDLEYQIKWEQEHLDNADLIVMVLSDNSKFHTFTATAARFTSLPVLSSYTCMTEL